MFQKENNEHQMIVINREKTFKDAKQLCKDVGGKIAAPLSDSDIREWLMVMIYIHSCI